MKVLHSEDIFCHAVYQLKLVRFGISTWKHNLSDGRNDCPGCWKVLRGGAVPEPHQQNCWDQPLPAVTQRILHRTLPFSTLSFILTSAKVSSIFPFPVITPDSPAVLLKDLHFLRVLLSFLPAGEAGRTSVHLYAPLFPKSTMWLDNLMNPKSLIVIHISYVLGAAVS